jgi:hypothetical protein
MDNHEPVTFDDTDTDDRYPVELTSSITHLATVETEDVAVIEEDKESFVIKTWEDRMLLDKPVSLLPAYVVFDQQDSFTGYNAVVNDRNAKTYYVGRNYTPVQNRSVREFLEGIVDTYGLDFRTGGYDHGVTWWEFIKPDSSVTMSVNGRDFSTAFRIRVDNSYTGSSSLRLTAGGIIHYCQNAFGLPTKRVKGGMGVEYKVRHTTNAGRMLTEVNEHLPIMVNTYTETLSKKKWNVKPGAVIYNELLELFPDNRVGVRNPAMVGLDLAHSKENWGSDDYNWFMALTNATTYPEKYGLKDTAIEKIRRYHDEAFFV